MDARGGDGGQGGSQGRFAGERLKNVTKQANNRRKWRFRHQSGLAGILSICVAFPLTLTNDEEWDIYNSRPQTTITNAGHWQRRSRLGRLARCPEPSDVILYYVHGCVMPM